MEIKLSLVVIIVNSGYSEQAMELAKLKGARGGTILSANGSVRPEAEKLYGITIHEEKEILLVTVKNESVDDILKGIYENLGRTSEAQGVAFSLSIEHATSNLYKQYIPKDKNN